MRELFRWFPVLWMATSGLGLLAVAGTLIGFVMTYGGLPDRNGKGAVARRLVRSTILRALLFVWGVSVSVLQVKALVPYSTRTFWSRATLLAVLLAFLYGSLADARERSRD